MDLSLNCMGSQKYPKFCTQSEEQSKLLWSQDYHRPRFKRLTSWGLQRLSACQRLSSGSKAITKRRRPSLSQQVYLDWNTRVATVYAYILYIYTLLGTNISPFKGILKMIFLSQVGYVSSLEGIFFPFHLQIPELLKNASNQLNCWAHKSITC